MAGRVKAREALPMRRFAKSYQMFDYTLLFFRWMADFTGLDSMVPNYRFGYRTAMAVFALLFGSMALTYSFFFFYPDYYKMCEVVCIFGYIIQGLPKFFFGYYHRHFYLVQLKRIRQLHYKYRNHEILNAKLLLLMERVQILSKLLVIVFFYGGVGFTIFPLYTYFKHGELILMESVRVPWVDAETYSGYVVTLACQAVMISMACTGISTADIIILLFVANLICYVDVFTIELDKLNVMLNEKVCDEARIKRHIRKICTQHQEIIEYESEINKRYVVICFGHVAGSVISMSGYLFLIYMINFIPGYGCVLAAFLQLLQFCLLGTVLTVKNEEIIAAIYSAHWYKLAEPERRCFALMLHKSQSFTEMTIGGFAPLNLETFVAIMNRIYSYFMMLISFIE